MQTARRLCPGKIPVPRLPLVAVLTILLVGCGDNSPPAAPDGRRAYWPTHDWREAAPEAHGMRAALLEQADTTVRAQFLNIRAVLVVRHGYLVFERYYAGYDRSAIYSVQLIAKSVTSAVVGIALERTYLQNVDERIVEYLDADVPPNADPRVAQITIRHLLTMAAGFAWTEDRLPEWYTSPNWIRYTLGRRLIHDPGTTFTYDTPAAHLLSAILAQATHMSEADFAAKQLFQPLGITPPVWPADPQRYTVGSGELYLSARDLAKFGYLYLNDGFWDGTQVVPADWVRASTTEYYRKVGFFGDEGYGYLWWVTTVQGHVAYFAMGYGAQYVYVVPDLDLVVVITARSDIPPDRIKDPGALIRTLIVPACVDTGGPGHG